MQNFIINLSERFFSEEEIKKINNSKNVLIQIFSGEFDKIENHLQKINKTFDNAVIIGASTDGEIENNKILTKSTIATVTIFEETSLEIAYVNEKNEYESGKKLIKQILKPNTKAIISFCNPLYNHAETFLEGINEYLPKNVIFTGGLTGDNSNFEKTFIIYQNKIYHEGAIGVSLNSDILQAKNFYTFGWESVGREHIITDVKDNIVYTIDNISADKFYKKYLGKEVEENFPKIAILVPLIVKRDNLEIARAVLGKNEDGSIIFPGKFTKGEKVKIGIYKDQESIDINTDFAVESFFVYACMAKRIVIPNIIKKEINTLSKVAFTSGFFTYGEFFTYHNKAILLNHTTTILALSEKKEKTSVIIKEEENNNLITPRKIISNILEATAKDYEEIHQLLREALSIETKIFMDMENLYKNLISTMREGVLIIDYNFKIKTLNDSFLKMYNCEDINKKSLFIDKNIDEFLLNFSKEYKAGKKSFETKLKTLKGFKDVLINISEMKDKKSLCLITISDISELKSKERQLLEKSKLEQMGEMVNMIAHQWRQPLNVLSSIGIILEMKASMNQLNPDEVKEQAQTIQKITNNMSQIIDDFLTFSTQSKTPSTFKIYDIILEALHLIKAQLRDHNIEFILKNVSPDITIHSHKRDILHILLNLLANARDALDKKDNPDKKIYISAYTKNNFLYLEVEDNAGGICEKIIGRIFEPYFTTKGSQGTGLGLYMSKILAEEKLKGDIFVENTEEGAKFTLKIPTKI